MIKGGKGGANTGTGLKFEQRVSLVQVLDDCGRYVRDGNRIFHKGKEVGLILSKNGLYKHLLAPRGVDYKKFLSKKLLPDCAILVGKTLHILEIKFQFGPGSVDEKLQTCDFKLRQYTKLLEPLSIHVKYAYILNEWFAKPEYKDVLEYIEARGCKYYWSKVPLDELGLP